MKSQHLSKFIDNRDNNFNIIRFVAAFAVLFSHCYPTTGSEDELTTQFGFDIGDIAVDIFFVTSGFLVTHSLIKRHDIRLFVLSRFLRIYPGLWVSIFFNIFIIGIFFTTLSASDYLTQRQTIVYFTKNLIIFFGEVNQLPGVFKQNHYHTVINASLWSLPWELRMYAMLTIIGTVSQFGKIETFNKKINRLIIITLILSLSLYVTNYYILFTSGPLSQFFRLSTMFFIGATFVVYRSIIVLSWPIFIIFIIILSAFSFTENGLFIPYVISIGYLTLFLAYIPSGAIRTFNQLPDYSYGLYIYGFPVQQSVAFIYPHVNISTMLAASFVVTLAIAYLSWHLVEKPSLNLKKFVLRNN